VGAVEHQQQHVAQRGPVRGVPAWPWPLTSPTAQAVGSWLVPIGLGNLAVLVEGDLRRARVPALTSVAYDLLQLGALVRYGQRRSGRVALVW
jgi:hypothetical protein